MGKEKVVYFLPSGQGFKSALWKFHSAGMYVTSLQRSNVQVTITVTCLNFAVTGSRILLHPLSSSRRGKPSRIIALNSNGEVNYRELARRPCVLFKWAWERQHRRNDHSKSGGTLTHLPCMTTKMGAKPKTLHSGQRGTWFPCQKYFCAAYWRGKAIHVIQSQIAMEREMR